MFPEKYIVFSRFGAIISLAQQIRDYLLTRKEIVGVSPKQEDITVNVCKKKQMTNMRAAGSDDALRLVPPRKMSLEQCLEFLADDELLEVTPKSLRLRKSILDHGLRMKTVMRNR